MRLRVGDWCRIHSKNLSYNGELAVFKGRDSTGSYLFALPARDGKMVRIWNRDEFIVLSTDDTGLQSLIDFALDIGDKEWFKELTLLLRPK